MCTAILECVEVVLFIVFTLVRGDSTPIEVSFLVPLTSQVATVLVAAYTLSFLPSRKSSKQAPWHMVVHSMGVAIAVIVVFATVLTLSTTGNLPNLVWPHGVLFMISPIIGYRPPESQKPSFSSEIALNAHEQSSLAPSLPGRLSSPQS